MENHSLFADLLCLLTGSCHLPSPLRMSPCLLVSLILPSFLVWRCAEQAYHAALFDQHTDFHLSTPATNVVVLRHHGWIPSRPFRLQISAMDSSDQVDRLHPRCWRRSRNLPVVQGMRLGYRRCVHQLSNTELPRSIRRRSLPLPRLVPFAALLTSHLRSQDRQEILSTTSGGR